MSILLKEGGQRYCFICGDVVDSGLNLSAEHIIPQWLIRQADLTRGGMQLPNFQKGASLRSFLRSKVDCCFRCNNALSKDLEPAVKEIVSVDRQGELRRVHRQLILLWLAKIYYANSFAGMSFAEDPSRMKDVGHEKLTNQKHHISILDNIQSHLFDFVQNPNSAPVEKLGSIFTFRCLPTPESDFYYNDGHQHIPVVTFRYKTLGVVAYLAGGNRAESMFERRTLAWISAADSYDLDIDHLKCAKKQRLINEQLLDVASIIGQLGTAYLRVPGPSVPGLSYARPYRRDSSFGDVVLLPYRRYYLQSLLSGNIEWYERWQANDESLLVNRATGLPITFSIVKGPSEGGLRMSHVRYVDSPEGRESRG